jgi:hypothetical protein
MKLRRLRSVLAGGVVGTPTREKAFFGDGEFLKDRRGVWEEEGEVECHGG